MDHQQATQIYLWGMPIVGMTRRHLGIEDGLRTSFSAMKKAFKKTDERKKNNLPACECTEQKRRQKDET